MTAQGVISDAEARLVARAAVLSAGSHPGSSMSRLALTGEITTELAATARETSHGLDLFATPKLWAYVAHHGERPPVDGWGER